MHNQKIRSKKIDKEMIKKKLSLKLNWIPLKNNW